METINELLVNMIRAAYIKFSFESGCSTSKQIQDYTRSLAHRQEKRLAMIVPVQSVVN